jgi:hypothetical protein
MTTVVCRSTTLRSSSIALSALAAILNRRRREYLTDYKGAERLSALTSTQRLAIVLETVGTRSSTTKLELATGSLERSK